MKGLAHHRHEATRPRGDAQRGAVLITVSICLAFLVTATALTVDIGRLSALRRDLQATADVLSLDLVRVLGGRTAAEIVADPAWAQAITDSRARNRFGPTAGRTVAVSLGTYDDRAAVFTPSAPAQVPKAVRVVTTDSVGYAFVRGSHSTSRTAIAVQSELAGFSLGSIGVSLNSGDAALLDAILGDALDVDAIAYSGLAGGQVRLPFLVDALGLSLGDTDGLLTTDLTMLQVVRAEAEALRRGGDLAGAQLLDSLASSLPNPTRTITLGQVMAIEAGGENAAAVASLDALRLLTATALVANGTNLLRVPDLGISVPGLAHSSISLKVIEKPQFVFGPVGAHVDTSQVSLVADVAFGGTLLPGVTVGGRAAVTLGVANGSGTITAIGCRTPKALAIAVQTGLVTATVGLTGTIQAQQPVATLDLGLATTHPSGSGTVGFTIPPDQLGVAKRYDTGGIGLSGASVVRDQSALVGVSLLPLTTLVGSTLGAVVNPTLALLDQLVTGPLDRLLGLSVADADVAPLAVTCAAPQLAG